MACGRHEEDLLADIVHRPVREDRLVMGRRRGIVGERHILGRHHKDNARGGAHGAQVYRSDAASGDGREAESKVQCIGRRRDVVDIAGNARDVQRAGIMGEGFGNAHA